MYKKIPANQVVLFSEDEWGRRLAKAALSAEALPLRKARERQVPAVEK